MSTIEERVARLESLLGQVFRPGGTIAIRDGDGDSAAVIVGDSGGDIGSVLMSFGLSVKEIADDRRMVVTSTGIGVKDERDVLRLLVTQMGVLFLDERGEPVTLIAADGIHKVADAGGAKS
jgi:hypothetical protein